MTSIFFCLNLLTVFNRGIDTLKIPAINSSTFEIAAITVAPLYPSNTQNDSLVSFFNNRILFKDFYLDRKLNSNNCNKMKIGVFIGCKNDSISIGFDLNENNKFETSEITTMPSNNKSVVNYIIYPKNFCNTNSFVDSTVIHLIPFVNQVSYNDLSATDTMLQITVSKGFVKKYTINNSLTLSAHSYSIRRIDSVYIHKYIVQTDSGIYALYPDRDLVKVDNQLYSIVKNFNTDTLYLVLENGFSEYKVSRIGSAFYDSLNIVNLSNKKPGEIKFKKKYILLDFWGTWCLPCIKAMPYLDEINQKYNTKIQVISFCIDENKSYENAQRITQLNKSSWEQYFVNDGKGDIYNLLAKYGIISFPTFILIDNLGNVIEFQSDISKLNLMSHL